MISYGLTDASGNTFGYSRVVVYGADGKIKYPVGGGSGTVTSVGFAAGIGISLSGTNPITTSGVITIINSAPDQVVSLSTTGTGLSITGTYPTFTLQNTLPDLTVTLNAGTGIGVTGTYPNFTISSTVTGGIQQATASGTDTYTATIPGVISYTNGDAYLIRFTNGNTTGCTLNINGLGARTLYRNNDGVLIGGDIVSGAEMLCVYNSTITGFQVIGTAPNTLLAYVTNDDSVTLTKGMSVYAFGGTGDRMTVKRASNTADATSARTVGLVLSTSIAANQKGFIMMQGLLDGLNILPTSTYNDGDPVYLGSTPGSITKIKPYAPNHLVYLGIVTTASPGSAGRMYVKVQNGYELDELHNVQAQTPSLSDTLWYDNTVSPPQWKTASLSTILGYTPVPPTRTITINGNTQDLSANRTFTVTGSYFAVSAPNVLVAVNSTQFNFVEVGATSTVNETIRQQPLPAGTLSEFVIRHASAHNGNGTITYTVRKNSADTALVISVIAGSAAGNFSDLINTATSNGTTDLFTIRIVNASTLGTQPTWVYSRIKVS